MVYSRFLELCAEKKQAPSTVATTLGFSKNPTFRAKKSPVKSGLFVWLFGFGITLVCRFDGIRIGISTNFYPLNGTARCTHLPPFISYWNLRNYARRVSVKAWASLNDVARNRSFALCSRDNQGFLCVPTFYWLKISRPRTSSSRLRIRNCISAPPTECVGFFELINRLQCISP